MTLGYFACEISNGPGVWVDLNDSLNYKVAGGETRDGRAVQWRRIVATNPVMEGEYLVHAVKEKVIETVNLYVLSDSQVELATNISTLENLFSQFSYQLKFTFDSSVEIWDCWAADYVLSRSAVWTHSKMAMFSAQVPRFPDVTYQVA